jgi:glycosyltransferase involved in cell wall biosynthesis
MTTTAPISVIIPVHNNAAYLGEAVTSVLDQTRPPAEVIAVDDGSTDGSSEVLKSFAPRIKVIRQVNRGTGAARNRGLEAATQEYVAWLDADDLALPTRFEVQLRAFGRLPRPDIVFGGLEQFVSPELATADAERIRFVPGALAAPLPSCFMARSAVFDRVGPLRSDTDATFMDWYLRALDLDLVIVFTPEVIARRRLHTANRSLNNRDLHRDYIRILKGSLDRRRGRPGN